MDEYAIGVLTSIGLLSFVALSAYLLLIAGELSFGQQGFFGVGAYAGGICTAMLGLPLPLAIFIAMAAGAAAAGLVGLPTLRLRGLYFAMATLAAAEMLRILFELFHWQVRSRRRDRRSGRHAGLPRHSLGVRARRRAARVSCAWSGALLALVVARFVSRSKNRGSARRVRALGEDPELAGTLGIDVLRLKLGVVAAAGALAALGGALFAHHNTYIEPRNFDIMLGVHSLAYALIGGLGTALGPLLGVALDLGLLEGSRVFQGYRMIVFGGLVALLLIWRPRGLLDERVVHWLRTRR